MAVDTVRNSIGFRLRMFVAPLTQLLRIACVAILLVGASFAAASDIKLVSSRQEMAAALPYTRTLWRVADGLPEETVQALLEAPNGSLWVGSTGGLASFDGSRLVQFNPSLTQALGVNSVFCLEQTRDGSLWIGAEGGGLLRIRGGQSQVFGAGQGLTDAFVRSIVEDREGVLWVGTDGGLFRLNGSHFERIDNNRRMPQVSVHSLLQDHEGRLWIGGSHLIVRETDGSVRELPLPGEYSKTRVKKILQTSDGTVWVGTVGGLQRYRNGHFEKLPSITATVRSLVQTTDGTLWIGTIGDGLWQLHNGHLGRVQPAGLLPSDTVLSILEDRHGQIWLGTQAGLVRLNRTPVSVIPLPRSGDPDFETISPGTKGEVWVGAQTLYVIRDGVAHPLTNAALGNASIRNTLHARDGSLWVGTDGSGVYHFTANGVRHFSATRELTNNFVRAFLEERSGAMWVATDEGVNRIVGSEITQFTEQSGLAYFSTRCLLEDSEGGVWIGTDRGISRWLHGKFVQNNATRALQHEKVWAALQDKSGTLWFGTRDHGLFRFKDGALRQFTREQGLPVNSIYQILDDGHGRFWLTGADTIASVDEADLNNATPGTYPSVRVYTMPFGTADAQLYGGRQPAGFVADDGSAWFPTSRGAAHVLREPVSKDSGAPVAVIDGISVDGRLQPATDGLHVPAGVLRLSFPFSSVYLRSQKGLRFRYMLESLDRDWTTATAMGQATYTSLPAGNYRFRLQTFDTANPGAFTEADLSFSKAPLFYQTVPFYLACTLALAAIATAAYLLRLRRLRAGFVAILTERARLAREMHDTVIQGCTGISALLEAVASTAPGSEANPELLDHAREQTRVTINEARRAVWDMRHEHERSVELIGALRGVAMQMSREGGPVVSLDSTVEARVCAASTAHELLMTAREAVYNAVQHSRSPWVSIHVHETKKEIIVTVKDAGVGFSTVNESPSGDHHFGIVGMYERMHRVGGSADVTTRLNRGTSVTLRMRHVGPAAPRGISKLARRLSR